jgi:hypothetical protein
MRLWLVLTFLVASVLASGQVLINEVCAANADVKIDPDYGNFSSWLELYNPTSSSKDISWFMLSDDVNNPGKWLIPGNTVIPAKGHLQIWCDEKWQGLHAGFSLNADGESIILSNNSGVLLDQIDFPKQYANHSYGRTTDGASAWKYTATPSPGSANNNSLDGVPIEPPILSKPSGRYTGPVTVTISHSNDDASIRYTTNGSEPTPGSLKYNGSIKLSATAVIKAKAFHSSHMSSETVSGTYLISEHASNLPLVSISTSAGYLWDNTIGIYTDGTNGIPGNCNGNNMNWNQDWNRHAVFEYLSPSGSSLVNQHVDIRIGGACSRNFPQKSFVIQPKKKYGSGQIEYPFFPTKKKVDNFGELFLRNSGNDFNTSMFRDALFQSLGIGQMDLDYMAYQPTVFYLNGAYWGIQNLREKIDGDFIESNYGIDKNDVDLIETWENAIEGTNTAWVDYKNTLATLNPTDPATFDFIDEHIDVQEYINYLITEIYVGNTDWPGNNVKFWRQISTNGKFRWILWDTDFGFGLYGTPYDHPTLNFATEQNGPGWPNPPWSTLHIRLVLQNPEFRNRFIATLSTAMSTTFHPDRVDGLIDQFKARIQAEVPYHKQRWGGTIYDWEYEVNRLRYFSEQRNPYMQAHMASFFGLGSPLNFTVKTSPAAAGKVNLNGVVTGEFENAPYYAGIPYNIKVIPNAGFRFTGWTVTANENENITLAAMGSTWKYFDQGILPAANWTTSGYSDATWVSGNAQLGYSPDEGDETTTVSYGPDPNNKYITTYFRQSFNLTEVSQLTDINASVSFDDGVVVYLNGAEVFRNNLPAGVIDNNTLASAAVETLLVPFTVSKDLLTVGTNVWAIEVHQSSGGSSDVSFDFEASVTKQGNSSTYELTETEVYDTAYSDVTMVANFEVIEPIEGIVLNEISPAQSFAKDNFGEAEDWIELYNASSQAIDLTGVMVTDDLTEKDKHILGNNGQPWMLQPGGYQILWADNQQDQGKDHLNFKLSADGEAIGVYHVSGYDTTVFAEVEYPSHSEGFSLARLPNGEGPFTYTNVLTPGAANLPMQITATAIYPNPASESVTILIQSESTSVSIFDLMGRKIDDYFFDNPQKANLDIRHLSNGVYFIKIVSSEAEYKERLIIQQ